MRRCVYCFGEFESGERPRSETHERCARLTGKLAPDVLAARREVLGRLAGASPNALGIQEGLLAALLGVGIKILVELRRLQEGKRP